MREDGRPHVVPHSGALLLLPREGHSCAHSSCAAARCVVPSWRAPSGRIHPQKEREGMSKPLLLAAALLAFALAPARASAQGREVTGRVTRTLGQVPVGLATITEVGGQGVAQSGADGTFRITVAPGDVRLLIRAIGYQRKDVTVKAGESNVAVTLDEDPFKLEAVVVTGQATTLERRNATTATVQVTNDELTRAPAQSLEQAMQGKVPGATISMN